MHALLHNSLLAHKIGVSQHMQSTIITYCSKVVHLQNVTPKDESVFDEKLDSKDTLPSQTLGIFKHEFGSGGKIKSTWFLRQFSKDEAARKV